jgi:hypothetical protein
VSTLHEERRLLKVFIVFGVFIKRFVPQRERCGSVRRLPTAGIDEHFRREGCAEDGAEHRLRPGEKLLPTRKLFFFNLLSYFT